MVAFLDSNMNTNNRDFLFGYAVHVLTDIENSRRIWMPFYQENKELLQRGIASQYHSKVENIDLDQVYILEDRCYI